MNALARPAIDLAQIPVLGDWGMFTETGLSYWRCPSIPELKRSGRILSIYGRKLAKRVDAWQLVVGDWLNLCYDMLGEDAIPVIEKIFPKLSEKTIRSYLYVAQAIPLKLRENNHANFSVLKAVAYATGKVDPAEREEVRKEWVDFVNTPQDGELPTVEDIREALHQDKEPKQYFIEAEYACTACGVVSTIKIEIDRPAHIVRKESAKEH